MSLAYVGMDTVERHSVPGGTPSLCRLVFLNAQVGPLSKLLDDESQRRHGGSCQWVVVFVEEGFGGLRFH